MSILEETLATIVPADRAAMDAAWQRWDSSPRESWEKASPSSSWSRPHRNTGYPFPAKARARYSCRRSPPTTPKEIMDAVPLWFLHFYSMAPGGNW